VLRRLPSHGDRDGDEQHQCPKAEHHLDLSNEVQQLRGDAGGRRTPGCSCAIVMPMLDLVREFRELRGNERVHDGEKKDARRHGIERIDGDPCRQRRQQALVRWRIGGQRRRKRRRRFWGSDDHV
jgi:hypothetical protein